MSSKNLEQLCIEERVFIVETEQSWSVEFSSRRVYNRGGIEEIISKSYLVQ